MEFTFPGFEPRARQFLRELRANNNRDWFKAHKPDYEHFVRGPLLELVLELSMAVEEHSPGHSIDPRKSVYRIYRDIRFSKNKDPYKTHAAAVFPPTGLERHAGAGFYFHFSAEELLVGGGVYAPPSDVLGRIRAQIAADPDELRSILAATSYRKFYGGLEGQQLKRTPRGYAPDHPAADLLVYKQFLSGTTLPADVIEQPTIGAVLDQHFRAIAPLMAYLNRAV
ncbi:MAG: DUF2461 domain-containing protein [Acidobacteriia bacterium]|nr:DUF2461 domain-containing protein [Terriglobia bacterium]